jgi:hypothetical protein
MSEYEIHSRVVTGPKEIDDYILRIDIGWDYHKIESELFNGIENTTPPTSIRKLELDNPKSWRSYETVTAMELPELDNLEKSDTFVKTLSEKVQAYLYKALYLNDMRIDKAEGIIARDRKSR